MRGPDSVLVGKTQTDHRPGACSKVNYPLRPSTERLDEKRMYGACLWPENAIDTVFNWEEIPRGMCALCQASL